MTSQYELIEKIRREKYQIGLDVSEEYKRGFDEIKSDLDNSLEQLSYDLYSEEIHFVLELIQNADDNTYYQNKTPLLKFIVDKDKILIQNNEVGFDEKNVKALCAVGKSTKTKSQGYIGEKGIGFKSVFRISDYPHIFSNGFSFHFKRKDEKFDLGYIVPYWVDEVPDYVNTSLTNIVLPLREDAKEHLAKFREIEPQLLLFLQKLSSIEIHNKLNHSFQKYSKSERNGIIKIKSEESEESYRLIKKPIKVPEYINEEKRKVPETEIVLGFPLNPDGSAKTDTEQKVFAFLPTRPYGFKFIIQADFLVPASREDIDKDKDWNKWIGENIPQVFLTAVEQFKKDSKIQKTFLNYLPLESEINDNYFAKVVEDLKESLLKTECILTESKKWLNPSKVFRASKDLRKLISNKDLIKFFDKEYLSPEVQNNTENQILDFLEISSFSIEDLIKCLNDKDWLEAQPDKWLRELYGYLENESLDEDLLEEIGNLSIIRLENTEMQSPNDNPIFFPFRKKQIYGFEHKLPFIKKETLSSKEVDEFLKKLNISNPQPFEIIENYILKNFSNEDKETNWQSKETDVLVGYTKYIKDNLNAYEKESDKRLNSKKYEWQKKDDPLAKLKSEIWIRFKKEDEKIYTKPNSLYLSKEYKGEYDLEFLFSEIEDIEFVHPQYLEGLSKEIASKGLNQSESNKKYNEELKAWRDFFVKLGVETKPRIELTSNWHPSTKIFSSPPIESIVEELDENKVLLLLKILDSNWDYYKQKSLDTIYEQPYDRRRKTTQKNERSSWYKKIKNSRWLKSTNKTFHEPQNIYLNKNEIKKILGNSVPYIDFDLKNEDFTKSLSINTFVSVEAVIEKIEQLVAIDCKDKKKFNNLYLFLKSNFENDEFTITNSFKEKPLIFVPGNPDKYVSSKESLWKNARNVFGNYRVYLEKHYPELKTFFVDKLGISEKPQPKDYADVLIGMTEGDLSPNIDDKVLAIYKELNTHLNSKRNEKLISEENWWTDFVESPIFLTHKSKFKTNEKNIFVNDDDELFSLFEDNSEVNFLKLPQNYYPKLKYFLNKTQIPFISEATKSRLTSSVESIFSEDLTQKVQDLYFFIIRYLYQRENDIYEKLKEDGRLLQLKTLNCHGVEDLEVEYILNNQKVYKDQIIYLNEKDLYVKIEYLEDYRRISIELSKLFESPKGLSDFLNVLFLQKSEDDLESVLQTSKIKDLPQDEKQYFQTDSTEITKNKSESSIEPEESSKKPESRMENPEGQERAELDQRINDENHSSFQNQPVSDSKPDKSVQNLSVGVDYETEISIHDQTKTESEDFPSDSFIKSEWEIECEPEEAEITVSALVKPIGSNKSQVTNTDKDNQPNSVNTSKEKKAETKKTNENLDYETKIEIGRWGEKYVLKHIKDELAKKYSRSRIETTPKGYAFKAGVKIIAEIQWLNKVSDISEGFDIKIIENEIEKYIEVKSTKTEAKDLVILSGKQWSFAQEKQDNFFIYRVYNAGKSKEAWIKPFQNPSKLLSENRISTKSISIKI